MIEELHQSASGLIAASEHLDQSGEEIAMKIINIAEIVAGIDPETITPDAFRKLQDLFARQTDISIRSISNHRRFVEETKSFTKIVWKELTGVDWLES